MGGLQIETRERRLEGPKRQPRKNNNRTLFKIRRANRGRRPMHRSQVARGPELTTGGADTLLLHNRDEGTEVGWMDATTKEEQQQNAVQDSESQSWSTSDAWVAGLARTRTDNRM